MTEKETQDLETIDVHNESSEVDLPLPRQNRRVRSLGRTLGTGALAVVVSVGVMAGLALDEAQDHDGHANDTVKGQTEQPEATTPTTIAPGLGGIKPDYDGPLCYSRERTIKPGDTVFGLTTKGLKDRYYGHYFVDQIFAWNLDYIKEQSQKDPALADPANIPIGHKLKIETDCLFVDRVIAERDYENFHYDPSNPDAEPPISGYRRTVRFQFYKGTDDKTHNLVEVNYISNPEGKLLEVQDCYPDPECYNYVAGIPSYKLPQGPIGPG